MVWWRLWGLHQWRSSKNSRWKEILVLQMYQDLYGRNMHTVLVQVCKRWSEHISWSFAKRVHLRRLRNEFKAKKMARGHKEDKTLEIAKCFTWDTRHKVEKGYNRTPCSIVTVNLEMEESIPPSATHVTQCATQEDGGWLEVLHKSFWFYQYYQNHHQLFLQIQFYNKILRCQKLIFCCFKFNLFG